jgi:hypothetical protein
MKDIRIARWRWQAETGIASVLKALAQLASKAQIPGLALSEGNPLDGVEEIGAPRGILQK